MAIALVPPHGRPTRLDRNLYVGLRCYAVTACTLDRQEAFIDAGFCGVAQRELFARAANDGFAIIAYCLMPDHAHVLLKARHEHAELTQTIAAWRQRTGFEWVRRFRHRLWQRGYWDRVLRRDEEVLSVARYIIENPVRARLVTEARAYPWLGSEEHSVSEILEAAQMDVKGKWRR